MRKACTIILCTHFLLHTRSFEKNKTQSNNQILTVNFDQQPAYAQHISFKKPLSPWDIQKIIDSYPLPGYETSTSYKRVNVKHQLDMKKKKLCYTLALRY